MLYICLNREFCSRYFSLKNNFSEKQFVKMIGLKTVFKLIFGITFLVLSILFFIFYAKNYENCPFDEPCIRFCSDDRSSKSDLDLLEHFKKSDLLDYPSSYKMNDGPWIRQYRDLSHYKVFRGEPECIDEENKASSGNYHYPVKLRDVDYLVN